MAAQDGEYSPEVFEEDELPRTREKLAPIDKPALDKMITRLETHNPQFTTHFLDNAIAELTKEVEILKAELLAQGALGRSQ